MDLALKNGFSELSFDEMEMVDGGGKWSILSAVCGVIAVAAVVSAVIVTGGVASAVVPGIIAYTGIASTASCAGCAFVSGVAD
jgi:lactobin A/cerein 7B family class IIb bacteriocin